MTGKIEYGQILGAHENVQRHLYLRTNLRLHEIPSYRHTLKVNGLEAMCDGDGKIIIGAKTH